MGLRIECRPFDFSREDEDDELFGQYDEELDTEIQHIIGFQVDDDEAEEDKQKFENYWRMSDSEISGKMQQAVKRLAQLRSQVVKRGEQYKCPKKRTNEEILFSSFEMETSSALNEPRVMVSRNSGPEIVTAVEEKEDKKVGGMIEKSIVAARPIPQNYKIKSCHKNRNIKKTFTAAENQKAVGTIITRKSYGARRHVNTVIQEWGFEMALVGVTDAQPSGAAPLHCRTPQRADEPRAVMEDEDECLVPVEPEEEEKAVEHRDIAEMIVSSRRRSDAACEKIRRYERFRELSQENANYIRQLEARANKVPDVPEKLFNELKEETGRNKQKVREVTPVRDSNEIEIVHNEEVAIWELSDAVARIKLTVTALYNNINRPFAIHLFFKDGKMNVQTNIDERPEEEMSDTSTVVSDKAIQADLPSVIDFYGQRDQEIYDNVKFRPGGFADGTDLTKRKKLPVENTSDREIIRCGTKKTHKTKTKKSIESEQIKRTESGVTKRTKLVVGTKCGLECRETNNNEDLVVLQDKNVKKTSGENKSAVSEKCGPRITEMIVKPSDPVTSPSTSIGTSGETKETLSAETSWLNCKTKDVVSQDEWDRVATDLVTLRDAIPVPKVRAESDEEIRPVRGSERRAAQIASKKNKRLYESDKDSDEDLRHTLPDIKRSKQARDPSGRFSRASSSSERTGENSKLIDNSSPVTFKE